MVMNDSNCSMLNVDDVSFIRKDRDGTEGNSETWYFIVMWVLGIKHKLFYHEDKVQRDEDYEKLKSAKQYT